MSLPTIRHTLELFKRIFSSPPPLTPDDVREKVAKTLEKVSQNTDMSLAELEDAMIEVGQLAWPYMQAFEELYRAYEREMGEKLLLQKASLNIRKKYSLFKNTGGTFQHLFVGSGSSLFTHDERVELAKLLIDLRKEIRDYTRQAVLSHDRQRYEEKIAEHEDIFHEITEHMRDLRDMAGEEKHKYQSDDINNHVRGFEHSMVFLGPQLDIQEVRNAREHFEGKQEERRKRGY